MKCFFYVISFFIAMNLQRDQYVLGIDFGTKFSCANIMTSREPDPITVPFPNGAHLLHSCVEYGKNADVGNAPYKHLLRGKSGIVKNVKMILGRYYNDEIVQRCKEKRLCAVDIEEIDNKPVLRIDSSTIVSPSDVASRIIQHIYATADKFVKQTYGSDMKCVKVTITFPAYFNCNQRTALLLAVEKAGIPREKIKMLNEPCAAVFHFCTLNKIDDQTILVYNLEDTTFDVSIVRVNRGDYNVLAFAGDPFLGGNDFYQLFAEYIERKCKSEFHVPLIRTNNERARHKLQAHLLSKAEEAVIELYSRDTTYVDLTGFGIASKKKSWESDSDSDDSDDEYSVKVSREELNGRIRSIIDRTIDLVKHCLCRCGLNTGDIDHVIMTGGPTQSTIIEEQLKQMFGSWKVSRNTVNPELAVARGACQSLVRNLYLRDRVLYSLDEVNLKGNSHCLIPILSATDGTSYKMETMPHNYHTRLTTGSTIQNSSAGKNGYEGSKNCELIGKYFFEGYTIASEPQAHFLTTYTIDEWGIIHIIVKSIESGMTLVEKTIRWDEPNSNAVFGYCFYK